MVLSMRKLLILWLVSLLFVVCWPYLQLNAGNCIRWMSRMLFLVVIYKRKSTWILHIGIFIQSSVQTSTCFVWFETSPLSLVCQIHLYCICIWLCIKSSLFYIIYSMLWPLYDLTYSLCGWYYYHRGWYKWHYWTATVP